MASRSPRRAELLQAAGIPFRVRVADIDESVLPGESPSCYVERLAVEKAHAVTAFHHEIVLAADTTVVLGHNILGKPENPSDAARMLRALSGRKHQVMTGICLRRGEMHVEEVSVTDVWFLGMSEEEIADYVATGEPMDKAGAYGIQGLASRFVDRIEGSYTNVVGLPISLVYKRLRDFI